MTRLKDREHAATLLAERLAAYKDQHPLVLGVPRGGVLMARIIADALGGDLDVVLVRKLRAAFEPELAVGAIDESGAVIKGQHLIPAEVSDDDLRKEIRKQRDVLLDRRKLYSRVCSQIDPSGRITIVVDDGMATGCSMLAAIRSIRMRHPKKIVVAVGVAPPQSVALIGQEADEVICLQSPEYLFAIGQAFEDFSEVTDDMVVAALTAANKLPSVSSG